MKKFLIVLTLLFALFGVLDAGYLTIEHFSDTIPPCSTSIWVDCGKVLRSSYAEIYGIPVALFGLFFYLTMAAVALFRLSHTTLQTQLFGLIPFPARLSTRWRKVEEFGLEIHLLLSATGVIFSAYFVFVQLGILRSICLYCMLSAVNTVILFSLLLWQKFFTK